MRGAARLWVMIRVAGLSATTSARAGSWSPLVSLMTSAPAAIARRATSGRYVSTEITTEESSRVASTTGSIRSSSSATDSSFPGANGWPPMSTQSAPSATAVRAAATARSSANVRPWS